MRNRARPVIIALMAIGLAGTRPVIAAEMAKVGILAPFSGKYSSLAERFVRPILIKRLKAAGVPIVIYDTESTSVQAAQLSNRLISQDNVSVVIAVTIATTKAVIPIAEELGIPVLSTSTLSPANYKEIRSKFPKASRFLFKPPAQKKINDLAVELSKQVDKPALLVEWEGLRGLSSAAHALKLAKREFKFFEPPKVQLALKQGKFRTNQFGFALAVGPTESFGNLFVDRLASSKVELPTLLYTRPDRRLTSEIVADVVISSVKGGAKNPDGFFKFLTKFANEGAFEIDWSVMAYALPGSMMKRVIYAGKKKKTCICNSKDGKVCKSKECSAKANCKKTESKRTCTVSCE